MRTATIRTTHERAELLARALAPDNTDEMETSVEGDDGDAAVVTEIERASTASLHSTVDDYVVNLEVACRIVERTTNQSETGSSATGATDAASPDTTERNNKHE